MRIGCLYCGIFKENKTSDFCYEDKMVQHLVSLDNPKQEHIWTEVIEVRDWFGPGIVEVIDEERKQL